MIYDVDACSGPVRVRANEEVTYRRGLAEMNELMILDESAKHTGDPTGRAKAPISETNVPTRAMKAGASCIVAKNGLGLR